MNATKNEKKHTGANIVILLGLLLLAAAFGLSTYNLWDNRRATEAADAVLVRLQQEMGIAEEPKAERPATEGAAVSDGAVATEEAAEQATQENEVPAASRESTALPTTADEGPLWRRYPDRQLPTITIDGYRYIGTLEIPSAGISLPVMEEWDYDRLKIAPCRYQGSPYLDSLIICGHNYAGHFSDIRYLSLGATVYFTDVDNNVFTYEVDNLETVTPTEYDRLTNGDWDLTLFTCHTGGQTRCVVRCVRIDPDF